MLDRPRLKTVEQSIEGSAEILGAEDARIAVSTVGFHASENRFKGDMKVTVETEEDLIGLDLPDTNCFLMMNKSDVAPDLASPSSKLRESFVQSSLKPFGVVSVIRGTDNDHEESGHEVASSDEDEDEDEDEEEEDEEVESSKISSEYERNEKKMDRLEKAIRKRLKHKQKNGPKDAGYDEKKTIKYLQEQMRRDTSLASQVSSTEYDETKAINFLLEKMTMMEMKAFTVDETIKTAISAFQHLFQKKFKANEIGVTVMDPNYFVPLVEADCKDIDVKELEMCDIEDHLAAINEQGGSVGSLCVGSRSGGNLNGDFCNGGASIRRVSVSMTSIMALCEENLILMAVDSRSTTYEFSGETSRTDQNLKLIDVGTTVVAAGTGQTYHIRLVKDEISLPAIRQFIAEKGSSLYLVARMFAGVVNSIASWLGLDFSLPVNYLAFMIVGFVQDTRGIFFIEWDVAGGRFEVKPPPGERVSYLGSGIVANAIYQQLHPLPDRWTSADDAMAYLVSGMEETFRGDPCSGGRIYVRALYGSDAPVRNFTYEQGVRDGVTTYYLVQQ